jgi:hypothetical protein
MVIILWFLRSCDDSPFSRKIQNSKMPPWVEYEKVDVIEVQEVRSVVRVSDCANACFCRPASSHRCV